jgi:hypothetical protein
MAKDLNRHYRLRVQTEPLEEKIIDFNGKLKSLRNRDIN